MISEYQILHADIRLFLEKVLHFKKLLSEYELVRLNTYYDAFMPLHELDASKGVVSDRVAFFLNQFLKPGIFERSLALLLCAAKVVLCAFTTLDA